MGAQVHGCTKKGERKCLYFAFDLILYRVSLFSVVSGKKYCYVGYFIHNILYLVTKYAMLFIRSITFSTSPGTCVNFWIHNILYLVKKIAMLFITSLTHFIKSTFWVPCCLIYPYLVLSRLEFYMAGQLKYILKWVKLVVIWTKMSHWALVPGYKQITWDQASVAHFVIHYHQIDSFKIYLNWPALIYYNLHSPPSHLV